MMRNRQPHSKPTRDMGDELTVVRQQKLHKSDTESTQSSFSLVLALVLGIAIGIAVGWTIYPYKVLLNVPNTTVDTETAQLPQKRPQQVEPVPARSVSSVLFIGVISAPRNLKQRNAIRDTWKFDVDQTSNNMRFFVGRSELDDDILKENATHSDIVLLKIKDGYEQLSQKVPEAIRYAARAFATFDYFVKIDDDVFFNVEGMVDHLKTTGESGKDLLYLGGSWQGNQPQRNKNSKHYLPYSAYPKSMGTLPPYNEGGCYVISWRIVQYIDKNRQLLKPLGPLEDVTMALWLLPLQIHPTHSPRFISRNAMSGGAMVVKPKLRKKFCRNDMLVMPDVDPDLLHAMWGLANRGQGPCAALALE
eukprot:m.73061 g.73061  ORF g.73061 m.73061 type:complete len:362 (+) comp24518_c0_seq1:184-1269(+)